MVDRVLLAFVRACVEFVDDRGHRDAAQIAFFAVLSFVPLAMLLVGGFGFFFDDEELRQRVVQAVFDQVRQFQLAMWQELSDTVCQYDPAVVHEAAERPELVRPGSSDRETEPSVEDRRVQSDLRNALVAALTYHTDENTDIPCRLVGAK